MKRLAKLSCHVMLCCVVSCIAAFPVAFADSPPQKSQKLDLNTQSKSPTASAYQGQLRDAGGPVDGTFDLRFTLYTTQAGGQALQSVEYEGLALTNGLFSLQLDFGPAALEASGGWLEIAVRAHGSADSYIVLTPRQKLTSTPYAILAQAEPWSLIGVPVGFRGKAAEAIAADDISSPSTTSEEATAQSPIKSITALKDESGSAEPMIAASPQATQNFIAKFDNRGQPFTDSIMFDNGTNVGVGTTSPSFKLHVNGVEEGISIQGRSGTASNQAYMTFRNSAGTRIGYVGDGSTGDNNVFLASDNGDVTLITLAGRVLTATSSGNVGIGTANPLRALQIGASPDAAFTIEPADASPNAGYIRFGDRTGWKLHFTRNRESSAGPLNTRTQGLLMTLQDNGDVGIGTANPGFKLDVAGTIRASNVSPSDARLKNNVTPLTNTLDKLEQIRGVSFQWNDRSESLGHSQGQKDIGVIAQEVETIFPELVNTSSTDGYKAVDYSRLTAVLIEAVKELNAKNQALQAQSEQKDQEIQSLSVRLATLEQLVQKLAR